MKTVYAKIEQKRNYYYGTMTNAEALYLINTYKVLPENSYSKIRLTEDVKRGAIETINFYFTIRPNNPLLHKIKIRTPHDSSN